MKNFRHETCVHCGKVWNVSVHRKTFFHGYICPKCNARRRKRIISNIIGFLAVMYFIIGIPIIVEAIEGNI